MPSRKAEQIVRVLREEILAGKRAPGEKLPTYDALIEQFRVAAHLGGMPAWQREIIAGISDRQESLEDLARREAIEEANCKVTDLFEMLRYLPSPGMTNEVFVAFLGRMAPGAVTGVKFHTEE